MEKSKQESERMHSQLMKLQVQHEKTQISLDKVQVDFDHLHEKYEKLQADWRKIQPEKERYLAEIEALNQQINGVQGQIQRANHERESAMLEVREFYLVLKHCARVILTGHATFRWRKPKSVSSEVLLNRAPTRKKRNIYCLNLKA